MKITIDLPDTTTALGLFMNVRSSKEKNLISTNWLTTPKDGLIIYLDPKTCKITERKDETDDL